MRAVRITSLDGPGAVSVEEVPAPVAGLDEVLVDVRAAGVSFPEVLQSRGLYQLKPELPFVPGSEVAGVVAAAPDGGAVKVGDRVAAFPMLGGFAEQVVAQPDYVFALPDAVSFEQGAALPMNYLTAHFALVVRGRMAPGETVLVQGAAGGVGTAAVQVAKAFGAGTVVAVCSTDAKGEVAVAAGADAYVLAEGFRESVRALVPDGVDLVVDPVGGDRFTDSLRCLGPDGRLLVIGFTAGEIPTVKVNRLLLNNVDVVGVGWGAFVLPRPGYVAAQWAALLPHLESGALAPPVGATFPLAEAGAALTALESRTATGKLILLP